MKKISLVAFWQFLFLLLLDAARINRKHLTVLMKWKKKIRMNLILSLSLLIFKDLKTLVLKILKDVLKMIQLGGARWASTQMPCSLFNQLVMKVFSNQISTAIPAHMNQI